MPLEPQSSVLHEIPSAQNCFDVAAAPFLISPSNLKVSVVLRDDCVRLTSVDQRWVWLGHSVESLDTRRCCRFKVGVGVDDSF